MADDRKPKIIEGEVLPPESERPVAGKGWFASLGQAAENKAAARAVRAENEFAEEAVKNQSLRAKYEAEKRNVAVEVDKNSNIEKYTKAARGEIQLELKQQDAERAELKRREQEAKAAGKRAVQGHAADQAEEKQREAEAEAARLRAEADALDQKIAIAQKRRQLDRIENNLADVLKEAQDDLSRLRELLKEKLAERADVLDPVVEPEDEEEANPIILKTLNARIAELRGQIQSAEQRVESLG